MLEWKQLLNPVRRKELSGKNESLGTGIGRTEPERDYDRILFLAPTRRLADKTQVFPMEKNDSIRTRLTHSHEVSNLARSIGVKLAFEHAKDVFGDNHEELQVKRNIPSILAAVGLAHDLGNPPFGHQGEIAIQQWFAKMSSEFECDLEEDFLKFDGNAQTFRLLTRLQMLNDEFGINLTVATLAALVKYPSVYGATDKGGYKKHGVFKSDTESFETVWEATGLTNCERHPLAYVMEACDDIAYSVIDAEDIIKKGYASFYDLMDYLETHANSDKEVLDVVKQSKGKNAVFKGANLSSRELNDISMQMFRVIAISKMITAATKVFVSKIESIMSQKIKPGFELIKSSKCALLCALVKKFDIRYGFNHHDVLKLELEGSNYIKSMMDILWSSISSEDRKNKPFERYVYGEISENYRRVYESSEMNQYDKCQLMCDAISGMTESHLIEKCHEFWNLKNEIPKSTPC